MGMFDDIEFVDPTIKCQGGHPQSELQTKDFDCVMAHYLVVGGKVYTVANLTYVKEHQTDAEGKHWIQWKQPLDFCSLDGVAYIYTHCKECKPVLTLAQHKTWGDGVDEHFPRVEYRVEFKKGELVSAEPSVPENQSRDDVKKELELRSPLEILHDDERLARRHFELRGK